MALLAKAGVEFSKSHDLIYLFDLLPQDEAHVFSTIETDCELLNPFAVALRYDDSFEGKLDRAGIFDRISKFNTAAKAFLNK